MQKNAQNSNINELSEFQLNNTQTRMELSESQYSSTKLKKIGIFKKVQKKRKYEKVKDKNIHEEKYSSANNIISDESDPQNQISRIFLVKNINLSQKYYEESVEIFANLYINLEGVVRLKNSFSQLSFGIWQGEAERIESNKIQGLINVVVRQDTNKINFSQEQQLQVLQRLPDQLSQQVSLKIMLLKKTISENRALLGIDPKALTKEDLIQKDHEFEKFISNCFEYLKNIPSQKTIFVYNIGRIHPQTDEIQIYHSGYSQAYLDLLCVERNSLNSMLLRQKSIDLITDIQDIRRISEHNFNWMSSRRGIAQSVNSNSQKMSSSLESDLISYKIVTFDGFPITLHQKCKIIPISPYQPGIRGDDEWICEYYLQLYELDIELAELNSLINYRKRLATQQGNLSLDDYLKQELSLLFEDVEYSVHSQNFVDKFYSDKIAFLDSLLNQKRYEEEVKNEDKVRCRIRNIMK